jgi:hypothetical protein
MAKGLGRSQEAYDRFSTTVDLPLTIAAVVWLPFLIIPLFVRLKGGVAAAFDGRLDNLGTVRHRVLGEGVARSCPVGFHEDPQA